MKHVVSRPRPPIPVNGTDLMVHQVPAWQDNFIWLISAPDGETAAVDGPEAESALAYCAENGLRLTTILNTHTHPDHIGINRDLARRGLLSTMRVVGSALRAADIPGLTEAVYDGDRVVFGGYAGGVLLTEGHIDGHISYVFGDALFCGDTLFGAGCGYLFDGPPAKMHASLTRLAALPGETHVFCAHEYTEDNLRFAWTVDPENAALADRIRRVWAIRATGASSVPSTIAEERATNPFLRGDAPGLRGRVRAAFPHREYATAADVFAATRALKDTKRYRTSSHQSLPLETP